MERYEGVLRYGLHYVGSRSEGRYARLEMADGETLPLCRRGVLPNDDPFFEPCDGRLVAVEGTMSHGWLVVERLEELSSVGEEPAAEKPKEPEPATSQGPEAPRTASVPEWTPDQNESETNE